VLEAEKKRSLRSLKGFVIILNPSGAVFYNIGVLIICGSTFFIVFALLIAPKNWLTPRGGKKRTIFYLTLSFMFLFTLFFLLTVFIPSSTNYGVNSLFTLFFLACLELFVACSAVGIRRLSAHVPWIPQFGFAVLAVNLLLILASIMTALSIFSWIIAFLSWSYTVACLYEFSSATNKPA
jgi:hypothetical protein